MNFFLPSQLDYRKGRVCFGKCQLTWFNVFSLAIPRPGWFPRAWSGDSSSWRSPLPQHALAGRALIEFISGRRRENTVLLHFRVSEAFAYEDSPTPSLLKKNLGSQRKSNYPLHGNFLTSNPQISTWLLGCAFENLDKICHYHFHHPQRPFTTQSTDAIWHITYFSFRRMCIWLIQSNLSIINSTFYGKWNINQTSPY